MTPSTRVYTGAFAYPGPTISSPQPPSCELFTGGLHFANPCATIPAPANESVVLALRGSVLLPPTPPRIGPPGLQSSLIKHKADQFM